MRAASGSGRAFALVPIGLPHVFMVLAGLATFVLVSSVLRDRSEITEVWMVAVDAPAGAPLTADDLEAVGVSSNDPLLGAFFAADRGVPAGTVRNGVTAGEPLLVSDLVPAESADVGRTFTVPIDALVLEGLGLRRGDRVDVIGLDADDAVAYVVTDLEVIRLPGASPNSAFAAAGSRSAWVTVRVDQIQALDLSEALGRGDVELVRSTGAVPVTADRVERGVGS